MSTCPCHPTRSSIARCGAVALLLLAGVALWWRAAPAVGPAVGSWVILGVLAAVTALPPVAARTNAAMGRWRSAGATRLGRVSFGVGLTAFLYLLWQAYLQQHVHYPRFSDEAMHMIHARIMARGRLWLPAHPLPQFFESFFIFSNPVYTAMQFPGTSMLYVPGLWLGVPFWVTSIAIGAAAVGLVYRVAAELVDAVAGLVAAVWLLGSFDFRSLSFMVLSYPASLMLGLGVVAAWMSWRARPTLWRAAIVGAVAGWALITRPSDAVCVIMPVGVAMLVRLARAERRKAIATSIGIAVLAGLPLIGVQLAFDRGVTGAWLRTPHEMYADLYNPRYSYGSDPTKSPVERVRAHTTLPQKLAYVDYELPPAERRALGRFWRNVNKTLGDALPVSAARVLVPLGLALAACRATRRGAGANRVVLAVVPLFFAVYQPMVVFDWTYGLFAAGALLALMSALAGREVLGRFNSAWVVLLVGLGALGLPSLSTVGSEQWNMPTLAAVHDAMAKIPGRAVVFFRYTTGDDVHEEPVFNVETANIDDARIVRAHDLGDAEDRKLIDYYRRVQPDRAFYLYDRRARTLTKLSAE